MGRYFLGRSHSAQLHQSSLSLATRGSCGPGATFTAVYDEKKDKVLIEPRLPSGIDNFPHFYTWTPVSHHHVPRRRLAARLAARRAVAFGRTPEFGIPSRIPFVLRGACKHLPNDRISTIDPLVQEPDRLRCCKCTFPRRKPGAAASGLFPLFWKSQTFKIRRTDATSRMALSSSPMQQLAVVFQKVCWKRFRHSPGLSMQLGSRQPVPFLPADHWPATTSSPS